MLLFTSASLQHQMRESQTLSTWRPPVTKFKILQKHLQGWQIQQGRVKLPKSCRERMTKSGLKQLLHRRRTILFQIKLRSQSEKVGGLCVPQLSIFSRRSLALPFLSVDIPNCSCLGTYSDECQLLFEQFQILTCKREGGKLGSAHLLRGTHPPPLIRWNVTGPTFYSI